MQDMLQLSGDQKKLLEEFQKTTDEAIAKVLTAEQKKQMDDPQVSRGFRHAATGSGLPAAGVQCLKLTDEQKNQLDELQKNVDARAGGFAHRRTKATDLRLESGFRPGSCKSRSGQNLATRFGGPGFGGPGFGGPGSGGPPPSAR